MSAAHTCRNASNSQYTDKQTSKQTPNSMGQPDRHPLSHMPCCKHTNTRSSTQHTQLHATHAAARSCSTRAHMPRKTRSCTQLLHLGTHAELRAAAWIMPPRHDCITHARLAVRPLLCAAHLHSSANHLPACSGALRCTCHAELRVAPSTSRSARGYCAVSAPVGAAQCTRRPPQH
jgi:hypothetical protein